MTAMTLFIALSVSATLLTLYFLLRPLVTPPRDHGVSSERLNAAIYREQLLALERDFSQGQLEQKDYESARDELQLRLLDDTEIPLVAPAPTASLFLTGRRTAALVSLFIPLSSAGMYLWLGNPDALNPPLHTQAVSSEQVVQMVETLAARLKANPDNPKGWAMLARSYKVMGRYADAEDAFKKAGKLVEADPDLLVDYADVLAAQADYSFEGKPLALIDQALAMDPKHPLGLMISGMAAFRTANFPVAIAQWERLLDVLEPGSPDALQIETALTEARAKAGLPDASGPTNGKPTSAQPQPSENVGQVDQSIGPDQINQMVQRLADRLKTSPEDYAGWARLARAYQVQERFAEADNAYAKAVSPKNANPDTLTAYADFLATRADGKLNGRPLELIDKALLSHPKHPHALMMAGAAAFQRADYGRAVTHWEIASAVLEPGSKDAQLVKTELSMAKAKLQESQATKRSPG